VPPEATITDGNGSALILTSLAASMAVNASVTGLIVFKILKVFLQIKATSVERTLDSLSSAGSTQLRHIIFIIESGMALFAIQLARVVITISMIELQAETPAGLGFSLDAVVVIQKMLNVIIRSVHFRFFFVLLMTFLATRASHQH
jgi:hypothetical protein